MAKLVAENTKANPSLFEEQVQMWVFEEEYTIPKSSRHYNGSDQPEKLSQLINKVHENVKYLPDITLPPNVIANPDLADSCKDSTSLPCCSVATNLVPEDKRQSWCDAQENTCVDICGGQGQIASNGNECDAVSLPAALIGLISTDMLSSLPSTTSALAATAPPSPPT